MTQSKTYKEMKHHAFKGEFRPMHELPNRAKDLKGNLEKFSVPVLVFSEHDPSYFEIGYYNFDTETWNHFGDVSIRLICWCEIPNPTEFAGNNKLSYVLHEGYCD